MLRSLARCPISHTLSAAESRFGEEKSHRNHLQHMKNGISNCYVNGVSNVYIYIHVCVCVFVNISMQYVYIQTCIFHTYIYICIFTEVDIYSKSRLYLQGMLTWVFCLQCRTKLCTNYSRSKHDLLNDFHFVYRIWNTTPVRISHHSGKASIKIISQAEFCQSNHKPKFELLLQKKSAPLEPSKQPRLLYTSWHSIHMPSRNPQLLTAACQRL